MRHETTCLLSGKPVREPHIVTPAHDPGRACFCCGRPFETYVDQSDAPTQARLQAIKRIPFALPEKRHG